ncbi:hypothetical protein Desku_0466 [Desulfofundulus kuznetsovii DSM 6115]|uniref:Uncharacterized protein n=1 Tax=Desulfofundulus kuznetsovii (strain DSM 6115 / VKM B-1805 / 17) TaxID=760568 RepID=A0AAU8P8F1_DESK7|nr:hypothetical protein Desku_0466 [Desulfofundulus kuznetsovii DSM 6115]
MIALASEQRMQNVIPVFQKGLGFEKVYLIRSIDADQPGSHFARAVSDVKEPRQVGCGRCTGTPGHYGGRA